MEETKELSTREKLIIAGMDDIRFHGVHGFSLRRAAAACGVSCAAPYKHFADKQELFTAMIEYVDEAWNRTLKELDIIAATPAEAIANASCEYVRYLNENPHFRAMLLIHEAYKEKGSYEGVIKLSIPVKRLLVQHKHDKKMSSAELKERIFIMRSLVFGAAVVMSADSVGLEERLATLKKAIIEGLG